MSQPKLLDTVAILNNLPGDRLALVEPDVQGVDYLPTGLVGTIVHVFERSDEAHYLIEFSDSQGREYATATLAPTEFLVLHQELQLSQ